MTHIKIENHLPRVIAAHPSKRVVATAGRRSIFIYKYDENAIYPLQKYVDENSKESFLSVALFDRYVVAGGEGGVIKIIDMTILRICGYLRGHTGTIYSIKVYNGHIFSCSSDGTVRMWCGITMRCIGIFAVHRDYVLDIDVCDGRLVSCGTDNSVIEFYIGFKCVDVDRNYSLNSCNLTSSSKSFKKSFHDSYLSCKETGSYQKELPIPFKENLQCDSLRPLICTKYHFKSNTLHNSHINSVKYHHDFIISMCQTRIAIYKPISSEKFLFIRDFCFTDIIQKIDTYERYLVLSNNRSTLILVDFYDNSAPKKIFLKCNEEVVDFCVSEGFIFVAFCSGDVEIVSLDKSVVK